MRAITGKTMRGAACLLILLLAAACGQLDSQDPLSRKERAWVNEHGPIQVACDRTYHPFAFLGQSKQPEGICVGMWQAMAKVMGFQVNFVLMEKPAQLAGLRAGSIDSNTGMFPIAERRHFLDFSAPFYPITTAIFLGPGSKPVRGLEGLHTLGGGVGAVKGDSGAAILINNNIKPVLYDTYRTCVEALGQGRIKAALMDDPVLLYWRQRLGLGSKISWSEGNAVVDRNDLALPVKKGNAVLMSIINKGLAKVAGAEMQRLRERYLN